MWPLQAYDLNGISAASIMYSASPSPHPEAGEEDETGSWFGGVYPTVTTIFMCAMVFLCIAFCLPLLTRVRAHAEDGHETHFRLGGALLERFLGETVSKHFRRTGELYLSVACTCLAVFFVIAVAALLGPTIVISRLHPLGESWKYLWKTWVFLGLCISGAAVLVISSIVLLARTKASQKNVGEEDGLTFPAWVLGIVVVVALLVFALLLAGGWLHRVSTTNYYSALFTSMRSLDMFSGVSPLAPIFLVCLAGFLWALSSFHRLRQLERFENGSRFLFSAGPFSTIQKLEGHVRTHLGVPAVRLPGAIVILVLAAISVRYLFAGRIVNSFEDRPFYWLMGVAFFAVHLALWLSVLRFGCVWLALRRLLNYLHRTPLKAYKRFQSTSPVAHKIDLASAPPNLSALAYSIDQARTISLRAQPSLDAHKLSLRPTAGNEGRWVSGEIKVLGQEARWSLAKLKRQTESAPSPTRDLSPEQIVALQRVSSSEMTNLVDEAERNLREASSADAEGDWRKALTNQLDAQYRMAQVADKVSLSLHDAWWDEVRGASEKPAKATKARPEDDVFQLGEDFLVGRVAHFLSYVLPQMQNLIVTSVSGLLLMLFAISSYPFQPHNLLLFFNWVVILAFVGIAMGVFIQMNRDPVMSGLNGTKAGKISWDWDFTFRILVYGIVPILALLGAQFPQSVGQVVSHFIPNQTGH